MIYLDNSATTRPFPEVIEKVSSCMAEDFFNPHAAYSPAVQTEREVEQARKRFLKLIGHPDGDLIYTSGGTESNNAALTGVLSVLRGNHRHVVSSMAEHPSVHSLLNKLEQKGEAEVTYIDTSVDGSIDPETLKGALRPDTVLVSCMHVNNETGAVTDLFALKKTMNAVCPDALLHADGVQAFCKLPFSPLACDLYSISGHKFHAPKGTGALYVRKGAKFGGGQIGGGQEKGLRSGTLNVPGILGMDEALKLYEINQAAWIDHLREMKVRLANELTASLDDVFVNGPAPETGAPHILNLSFLGVRGEVLLHALEAKQIYVSTGSACSSHKRGGNRILTSLGASAARQESAIRFSLCPMNTVAEIDIACEAIREQVSFLRKYRRR